MSRAKSRARRNHPVIPPTPAQIAEEQALRERLMARLDTFIERKVAQGCIRCPGCGRLEPPPDPPPFDALTPDPLPEFPVAWGATSFRR